VKAGDVKVAVVRMEGSNCEEELFRSFAALGAQPEMVHLNQLTGRSDAELRRSLEDYHVMMFPGGFSAGDYIRAGAIFAARMKASLGKDLERFVEAGKPIGGFCNGFQIMVELGLLPGLDAPVAEQPQAVLHINDSGHYECRPTLLKCTGRSAFTTKVPQGKVLAIPSAHAEGKLLFPKERQAKLLDRLEANGQVAFRYVNDKGKPGGYPWNPNGAPRDIAGLTNPQGNVFGMMPHPERAFWRWQHPDWTRTGKAEGPGDGQALFRSVLAYAERKL
jgi:phosphoribosylformylglycinamidine synthase